MAHALQRKKVSHVVQDFTGPDFLFDTLRCHPELVLASLRSLTSGQCILMGEEIFICYSHTPQSST